MIFWHFVKFKIINNLTLCLIYVIVIITVAQYSSQVQNSQDGDKLPLKGTSLKFLVPALVAQTGASAGS